LYFPSSWSASPCVGVKMAWHITTLCTSDMHKLSYSASFVRNTRDISSLSLSLASAMLCVALGTKWVSFFNTGVKTNHPNSRFVHWMGVQVIEKKLFMDHNLTNSCRKCSFQENVLYVLDWSELLWSFQHINSTALVKSRGCQICLLE